MMLVPESLIRTTINMISCCSSSRFLLIDRSGHASVPPSAVDMRYQGTALTSVRFFNIFLRLCLCTYRTVSFDLFYDCHLTLLIRETIVNRTYGTHKILHISLFLLTLFGPTRYLLWSPVIREAPSLPMILGNQFAAPIACELPGILYHVHS